MELIDGKKIADAVKQEIASEVAKWLRLERNVRILLRFLWVTTVEARPMWLKSESL